MDDGTTSYTYGLDRISQTSTTTEYFLGDALGSVRQLTNSAGEVTFAKAYDPYGVVTQVNGEGQSAYGYTGEQQSNDMVYLRARYYNSANGRFLNRDTFAGYLNLSQSQNRYTYTHNNPIRYTDPTGHSIPAPFFIALLRSGVQNIISYIADCDNQNYVIGALGQYVDDVTFGLYSNYFLDLDAFNQDGRNLGHSIALTQAMIETTIGTLAIAAALPTITITLVGGTACAAVTGGLCAIPVAPILVGEVGLLALGTALTTHGGVMIARAANDGGGGGGVKAWRPLGIDDLPSSYKPPKGGPRKVVVEHGPYSGRVGWLDENGDIWVASKPGESHGGPHWDVQINGGKGGHRNVFP